MTVGRLDTLKGTGMFAREDHQVPQVPQPEAAPEQPAFRRGGTAESTPEAKPVRRNAYAGDCTRCGRRVGANEGLLGDKVNGRWTVTHDGPCPVQQVLPGTEAPEIRTTTDEVHPGIYTLDKGAAGHRTFRVVLQASDAEFAAGQTIVEYLVGRDNENDYKGFAFLRGGRLQVWKRYRQGGYEGLLADAEEFLRDPEKALRAKHCLRCGRTLSTTASIEAGIGPECARRGW